MLKAFDLWSFTDVVAHEDAILEQVRSGHMPCDGAWPAEKVSRSRTGSARDRSPDEAAPAVKA